MGGEVPGPVRVNAQAVEGSRNTRADPMAYVIIIDKPEAKKFHGKCTTGAHPDYDYRPASGVAEGDENTEVRSVIDLDILGHIFEQSITDLERLRLSLEQAGSLQLGAPA